MSVPWDDGPAAELRARIAELERQVALLRRALDDIYRISNLGDVRRTARAALDASGGPVP